MKNLLVLYIAIICQSLFAQQSSNLVVHQLESQKSNVNNKNLTNNCIQIEQTVSQFKTGTTLVQETLFGDPVSIQNAQNVIYGSNSFVNQHLMGWGTLNPEPVDNQYNLGSLEGRIGASSGVVKDAENIVLTACCAPDWMKGGQAGNTDWSALEVAPLPQHYQDYADLVVHVVQQPEFQNIKYIQVWNEMKGFWNLSLNRWDYEGYTELYNKVWSGVKAVRPDIKIGGPYVVLNSYLYPNSDQNSEVGGLYGTFDKRDLDVIEYWLQHKAGADFIVVDGSSKNRDAEASGVNQWQRTEKFVDFSNWLRQLNNIDAQTLPIWWAEWYIKPDNFNASVNEINALMSVSMIKFVKSGVETALLWSPEGDAAGWVSTLSHQQLGLFTETNNANGQGGMPTIFEATQRAIYEHFDYGTSLYNISGSNNNVETLVGDTKMIFVNKTNNIATTVMGEYSYTLNPYEVKILNVPLNLLLCNQCNLVSNGDFSNAVSEWTTENCSANEINGIAYINNIANIQNSWDVKFINSDIALKNGETYLVKFDAWSVLPRSITVKIGQQQSPYSQYFIQKINTINTPQSYEFYFTMKSPDDLSRLELQLGGNTASIYFDNIIIKAADCFEENVCDLLNNGKFDLNLDDWTYWGCTPLVNSSGVCAIDQIDVVSNAWNAALAYPDLTIEQGEIYQLEFTASSTQNRTIDLKVGKGVSGWDQYYWQAVSLLPIEQKFEYTFIMWNTTTNQGRIEFQIGASTTGIKIDNVRLRKVDCIGNEDCPEIVYIDDLSLLNKYQSEKEIYSDAIIPMPRQVKFYTEDEAKLNKGFEVKEGAEFGIFITPCQ